MKFCLLTERLSKLANLRTWIFRPWLWFYLT